MVEEMVVRGDTTSAKACQRLCPNVETPSCSCPHLPSALVAQPFVISSLPPLPPCAAVGAAQAALLLSLPAAQHYGPGAQLGWPGR